MSWPRIVVPGAAVLALGVLGAHFWRAQNLWAVAACALGMGLLFVRRPWAPRAVQLGLAAGTLEWLWTAFVLAQQRQALGMPWLRMAAILGTVALLTALTAWALGRRH